MTVRQVFYQLVARGVIEKSEAAYHGVVIRLMTEMRLDGRLPFSSVVDESRRVRVTRKFDSIEQALDHTAKFYRRSALAQSSDYLEIWCEKDALAGVLWDVTSDYDVPLMISRGMPSLTFLHASAEATQRAADQGKRTFIYQFGDHDPSGVLIPKTIKRRSNAIACPRGRRNGRAIVTPPVSSVTVLSSTRCRRACCAISFVRSSKNISRRPRRCSCGRLRIPSANCCAHGAGNEQARTIARSAFRRRHCRA